MERPETTNSQAASDGRRYEHLLDLSEQRNKLLQRKGSTDGMSKIEQFQREMEVLVTLLISTQQNDQLARVQLMVVRLVDRILTESKEPLRQHKAFGQSLLQKAADNLGLSKKKLLCSLAWDNSEDDLALYLQESQDEA